MAAALHPDGGGPRQALSRAGASPLALLLAGFLALLALAGCHSRPHQQVAQGALLYEQHCATCHGPDGQGQDLARPAGNPFPQQEGFIAPALDNRGHCAEHPQEQLFDWIKHGTGVPGSPMQGWEGRLTDDQIRAVLAYLRSLWGAPHPG